MEPEKIKKIAIISVIVILVLVLAVYLFSHRKTNPLNYETKLEVWGLFDDSDVMSKVINEYKKRNPLVKEITYKKLTVESYENDLRDALATGKGPDIFLIHDTWLTKHQDKLAPAPDTVLTAKQVQDNFVDVVSQDFVKDLKVYALPLSVDSLALYYNKNLLSQAGLPAPPRTWTEFDEAVQRLTRVDSFGNITASGAAMGASSDAQAGDGKINRATDILTAIMMQAGAQMYDSKSNLASFAEYTDTSLASQNSVPPGQAALSYYTKFSNRTSKQYCWNSTMHNSVDSFIEGQTVMMLNYSWLIPKIQDKAPKLNLGISILPQNIDQNGKGLNIGFANYWGFAVSKNKVIEKDPNAPASNVGLATNDQRIAEAWKLIRYLTMPPAFNQGADLKTPTSADSAKYDPAAEYAVTQKKPAARRDLVVAQKNDLLLAPFAEGNIIAKSWPQPDNLAVEKIFDDMIDNVALRNEDPNKVIEAAENSVNVLFKK